MTACDADGSVAVLAAAVIAAGGCAACGRADGVGLRGLRALGSSPKRSCGRYRPSDTFSRVRWQRAGELRLSVAAWREGGAGARCGCGPRWVLLLDSAITKVSVNKRGLGCDFNPSGDVLPSRSDDDYYCLF